MKFSYNWLQTFFAELLPAPEVLAEKITFHSSEIEELITMPGDTVLDVKVLPDKSAWLMSHRGLAKDISVMLRQPILKDPFLESKDVTVSPRIVITRTSPNCDFYGAALIEGVKVGPSPVWLQERLQAVGQRSINNIVDATNFVMFELGQPLHAFDAGKLKEVSGEYNIGVRQAKTDETIVTLTGESYTLSTNDTLIVDAGTDTPVGIAGIKGGKVAAVDLDTKSILIESAHFDRVAVRNTSKRLKLQTDASKRFENGIPAAVAPLALSRVVTLILEIAGGTFIGENASGSEAVSRTPVSCTLAKMNSVLGLTLSMKDVSDILDAYGYQYVVNDSEITVTPPFERDDLCLPEDLIEEIGRMYGLDKIASIPPSTQGVFEYNTRHYYAEKIRHALLGVGFSEVYTSSFRDKDEVALENALASDKGCLRSTLTANLEEVRSRNIPYRDLLGLTAIKVFEIGTVFRSENEEFRVALAVQSGTAFKAKVDEPLVTEAMLVIKEALGVAPQPLYHKEGVVEFSLDALLPSLASVTAYETSSKAKDDSVVYKSFSVYPAVSRDVAMWVPETVSPETVLAVIESGAGALCVRTTHLDTFSKDGRTSFAFRLVFQSSEKTLTDEEVQTFMDVVYKNVTNQGWEPR